MEKLYLAIAISFGLLAYFKLKLMDHLTFLKKEIIRERNTTREDEVIKEGLYFINRLFGDQLKCEVGLADADDIIVIRIYKVGDDRNMGIVMESFSLNQFPYADIIELVIKDNFYLKGVKLFPEVLVK